MRYFEDFTPGLTLESRARTIYEADLASFVGLCWNRSGVHTDVAAASAAGYRAAIAPSALTLSTAVGLLYWSRVYGEHEVELLELSHVKYPASVHPGDTVRASLEVLSQQEVPNRSDIGELHTRITVRNQEGTVVMSGERRSLYHRRPSKEADSAR